MSKIETPVMTSLQTTAEKNDEGFKCSWCCCRCYKKTVKLLFQKVSAIVI